MSDREEKQAEALHQQCKIQMSNQAIGVNWHDATIVEIAAILRSVPPDPPQNRLQFIDLRHANVNRAAKWHGDGKAGVEFATVELAGEVGEVCNAVKKLMRRRYGMAGGVESMDNLREELADVVICCDLLAIKLDVDLAAAVAGKFNKTSAKHGFPDRLNPTVPPDPVDVDKIAEVAWAEIEDSDGYENPSNIKNAIANAIRKVLGGNP